MVNPIIMQTAKASPSLLGRGLGWAMKFKWAFIFAIYLFITILATGINTGDWGGALLDVGEQFVSPLGESVVQIAEINDGLTGIVDTLMSYLGLYASLYMIWIWYLIALALANFLMRGTNAPMNRYIIALLIFTPFFFSASIIYTVTVLEESVLLPFQLIGDLFSGLWTLILTPQFSFKFDLFGESVNTCVSNSTCTV